jgi:hypothetical protein
MAMVDRNGTVLRKGDKVFVRLPLTADCKANERWTEGYVLEQDSRRFATATGDVSDRLMVEVDGSPVPFPVKDIECRDVIFPKQGTGVHHCEECGGDALPVINAYACTECGHVQEDGQPKPKEQEYGNPCGECGGLTERTKVQTVDVCVRCGYLQDLVEEAKDVKEDQGRNH